MFSDSDCSFITTWIIFISPEKMLKICENVSWDTTSPNYEAPSEPGIKVNHNLTGTSRHLSCSSLQLAGHHLFKKSRNEFEFLHSLSPPGLAQKLQLKAFKVDNRGEIFGCNCKTVSKISLWDTDHTVTAAVTHDYKAANQNTTRNQSI